MAVGQGVLMGKVAVTMSLMKSSWQILKKDKELLLLPVISGVFSLSFMTIFIVQGLEHGWLASFAKNAAAKQENTAYWIMFICYYVNYLIIVFFNAAIVASVVIRINGGNPTLGDGLQAALRRFFHLAGWALVAATVGFLFGMVESGSRRGRGILARFLGIAWSLVSFFVVPLIVVEKTNPLFAMDFSMEMVRRTWGEQVIGNCSFGLVFSFLSLPVVPIVFLTYKTGDASLLLPTLVLVAVYLIVLGIFQSALKAIFNAVMYAFARDGKIPGEFSNQQLREAMRRI